MLLSPRAAPAFPDVNAQEIFTQIEKQFKERVFDPNGMVFTVQQGAKNWKVLLAAKYSDSQTRKIKTKDLDFYVFDPSDPASILGQGSQGKVVVAREISTGTLAAIKIQIPNTPSFDSDLQVERRNLQMTNRLCAIASEVQDGLDFSGLTADQKESLIARSSIHYTVMEYISGKDLNIFLGEIDKNDEPLSIARLAIYAIKEVTQLHAAGLAHRDIKPENFRVITIGALNEITGLKLMDLGTAILHSEKCKEDASSLGFLPPEYLQIVKERPVWDKACDVWQLGMVIAIMMSKHHYATGLQQHVQSQQETQEKRHLTLDEIHQLLPDIFGQSAKPAKEKKSKHKSAKDSLENVMQDLHDSLLEFIHLCTHVDRNKRPIDEALKEALQKLNNKYFKAHEISSLNHPTRSFDRYKALRRQNTVLDLRKAAASNSVPKLVAFSHEAPDLGARPARSMSSAAEKPRRIDVVRSPRKRTSTESKPPQSVTIDKEVPKLSLDSVSSSSLEQKMAKLSLGSAASGSSPSLLSSGKAAQKSEDMLEKLSFLQQSLALQTEGGTSDIFALGVSDFMMFSLIGKRLKSALQADGENQERQLASLLQLTDKYIPTRNLQLNQYVDSIRTTLLGATAKK
ncbi:MAG: protein kinase [Candidatus Berkiella sp.]